MPPDPGAAAYAGGLRWHRVLLLSLVTEPDGIAGQVLARLKVDAVARTEFRKIVRAPGY